MDLKKYEQPFLSIVYLDNKDEILTTSFGGYKSGDYGEDADILFK